VNVFDYKASASLKEETRGTAKQKLLFGLFIPFLLPSFFLIRFLKNIIVLVNQVFSLVEGTIGMHVIRKNAGKSDSIQR
jgi:hypothetical protein